MDSSKRKELMEAYKSREVIGGIYCIKCSGSDHKWIKSTTDMEGSKNRFQFSINIKACPEPAMHRDWDTYGMDSFSFECLEELKKGETQTPAEFADDIKALYEIWLEKAK